MATLDYQLSVDMGLVITREEAECQINRGRNPQKHGKGRTKSKLQEQLYFL